MPVREVVDAAAARAGERFRSEPLLEASVRTTLGRTYRGLAQYGRSEQELATALKLLPGEGAEAAAARVALAETLLEKGDYAAAREQLRAVLAAADGEAALTARALLIQADYREHGFAGVVAALDALRPEVAARLGADSTLTLRLSPWRAAALIDESRRAEAIGELQNGLAGYERRYGRKHPATLELRLLLNEVIAFRGTVEGGFAEAEAIHADALEALGPTHVLRLQAAAEFAQSLRAVGRLPEAEALLRDALAHQKAAFGAAHATTGYILDQFGNILDGQQRCTEALALRERSVPVLVGALGTGHWLSLQAQTNRAATLNGLGRTPEAETLLRRLLAALPPDHDQVGSVSLVLAETLARQGRAEEARTFAREALRIAELRMGPEHRRARRARELLAKLGG